MSTARLYPTLIIIINNNNNDDNQSKSLIIHITAYSENCSIQMHNNVSFNLFKKEKKKLN